MANLYTNKDSNIRKTWLLITAFLLFIIGFGWFFSYWWGSPGILYIAIFFSILMSVGSYWWSDKLVLAMTRAKPIKKEDALELYRIVENLSITAGLPMPRVYIIEEEAMNAFATGRNPKHAVVAITRGLLNGLERTELEGVLAHEMSHIGNRDMLVSTVVVVLAGIVILAADLMFRNLLWGSMSGGRRSSRDSGGQAGAILMAVGIAVMIIAPILAQVIKLAVSRKREFLADASGALLTRYPEGLARALEKISGDPTPLRVANNATAHLYFENPFKGDRRGSEASWFIKLFMTHPPVEERVAALRGMK
ncbi:MAG: M48 family metallopeptidase [Candidatus Spechtbacterales bacterium]